MHEIFPLSRKLIEWKLDEYGFPSSCNRLFPLSRKLIEWKLKADMIPSNSFLFPLSRKLIEWKPLPTTSAAVSITLELSS